MSKRKDERLTDLQIQQWAMTQGQAQMQGVITALIAARQRPDLSLTGASQQPPLEMELFQVVLTELYTNRAMLLRLMISMGAVRALTKEEVDRLVGEISNDENQNVLEAVRE